MVTNTILTKQPDFQNLPRFVYTPNGDIGDCNIGFLDGGGARKWSRDCVLTFLLSSYIRLCQRLYILSCYKYIREVKEMSEHIYEARIMEAWYNYDGPMSFEAFYATYLQ